LESLGNGDGYRYQEGTITVRVSNMGDFSAEPGALSSHAQHVINVGRFHSLVTLLRGITDETRVHAVNTPMLAVNPTNPVP
jgi:hypothetical protein